MKKCVIFTDLTVHTSIDPRFEQLVGYLQCLVDEKVLKDVSAFRCIRGSKLEEEIVSKFSKYDKIGEILFNMKLNTPKKYAVKPLFDHRFIIARSEIADEMALRELTPNIVKRFRVDYEIY